MAHAANLIRCERIPAANLITSIGAAATVPHQHLHIVPRREGDGLMLPWSGQVRVRRCGYCWCPLEGAPECSGGCAHMGRGYGGCRLAGPAGEPGTADRPSGYTVETFENPPSDISRAELDALTGKDAADER